jgi:hypothetical protein
MVSRLASIEGKSIRQPERRVVTQLRKVAATSYSGVAASQKVVERVDAEVG